MTRVLIIDDDSELSAMVAEYLEAESLSVERVFDGNSGVQQALAGEHDVIILDVMLPKIDGFEVLRRIRSQSNVPVLMLTAKGDDIDRIVGLEIGADDYLPKPFNPRELLARLKAILRRTQTNSQHSSNIVLKLGSLTLHPALRTAFIDQQRLEVTSTEFNLLQSLVSKAGHIVSKEYLSETAMGRSLEKYDRSIDMHLSNLRKKLAQYNSAPTIVTVRGQGFQLTDSH